MFMYFMLLGYLKCMSFGTFLVISKCFLFTPGLKLFSNR